jgi:hypothetical protein
MTLTHCSANRRKASFVRDNVAINGARKDSLLLSIVSAVAENNGTAMTHFSTLRRARLSGWWLLFARRIIALGVGILLAAPGRGQAAIVSLSYDTTGNEVSQQSATAAAPTILGSPTNQVVRSGEIAGFSVVVASPLAVTYQWYFNGSLISGATGDSLLLTNITSTNDGNYTVVVTNSSGSVTSGTYRLGFDGNGNGLPDSWELAWFDNLNQTAGGDYDGDSISNLDEYFGGTDPTVREIYYWIAGSGDFNNPTNWNRNRIPGVGDTAVINSGTFTLPANTTITVSQVTVNVPFTAPADTNFTLNISGNWTFDAPFTLANDREFAVLGGGNATITGATSLNRANLLVGGGSKLTFSSVTTYAMPGGSSVYWVAQQSGTVLSFPSLTTITGPATPNSYFDLIARYDNGATLSLPVLTTIIKPDDGDQYNDSGVRFTADNSTISAPNLSVFNDNDSHPDSSLTAYSNGVLALSQLTDPQRININLNAQSHPERFTSLVGTRFFQINSGTVVMSNLNSITGISSIVAAGGAQLSFPNVTSYTVPAGMSVQWVAQNTGTVLSFPNLTTITGPAAPNSYLDLIARYDNGATLSLPVLTTIIKPDDGDQYNDSGVRFTADNSTISAPNLSVFNDNDSHPDSSLTAYSNGLLALPQLTNPQGININLNAQSHPEQFTSLAGTRFFQINSGTVVMSNLSSITGFSSIVAASGAQLGFPNVTSYTVPAGMSVQWVAQNTGTVLSFPNLTTITGPATANSYFDLVARYDNGATLSLPALTTINKPGDGDSYNNGGVRFTADNSTISAPNLSVFNDNDSHPDSSLTAYSNGVLALPQLTDPQGVNINLNAQSHPERFTSLVGTRFFQINSGTVVMSNLNSIAGFSSIMAAGGAHLSFPNVTSYTVPAGMSVQWVAQNTGTVLSFPNLTTITGPATPGTYFDLIARYDSGATLSLPVLTTITKPDDGDPYNNSGVRFFADNSTISAPYLSVFYDNDSHPNSSLNASSGGTMILYSLTLSGIRGVTLNGVTLPATLPAPKAINLSTRMLVQTGDNVGIGGFIITGSTTKRVIIRAIGPSLTGFGVPNALADPILELHGPSEFVTIANDNWRDTQETEIQATGIPPADNLESAIVATLVPGLYTAIVRGNGSISGVGLIEVYDLNQTVDGKLANLSTRAAVSTGDNIVIAGFVLSIGSGSDRIVVRGLGPSLTAFGVPNVLDDPTLELRDANGLLLVSNNDWQDNTAQAAELIAVGLAPTTQLESAIVLSLPPGPYTALLSGLNNGTGVGIVEVYDLGGTP